MIGHEGGGRLLQRQVDVDRVEATAGGEGGGLGGGRLLRGGAGGVHGQQRQVVVLVGLAVGVGFLRQLAPRQRVGELAPQLAQLDRPCDDLPVPLGRVDLALVPVVQLQVEQRRRLPAAAPCRGVVGDRGRYPAEQ